MLPFFQKEEEDDDDIMLSRERERERAVGLLVKSVSIEAEG